MEKLNHNRKRVSNIKAFINEYKWKGIDYLSKNVIHWKTLLLIFYILKEKEICTAYILKINSNCEKKLILLMIPNKKKKAGIILQ